MVEVQSEIAELRIAGCTAQHRGDRSEQQDRLALITSPGAPHCLLGVLADGVGGRRGGALAAETAIALARRRFAAFDPDLQRPDAFFASLVAEIHTALRLDGLSMGLEPHSTFAAVLVQRHRADWCHVGDSRVYHLREGRILHCTTDQVRCAAEDRPPAAAGAAAAEVFTLGAARAPAPGFGGPVRPLPGDRFLLCSDGVWNGATAEELLADATAGGPREAAEHLLARARARACGRGDNCSLVLLEVSSPAPEASRGPTVPKAKRAPRAASAPQRPPRPTPVPV